MMKAIIGLLLGVALIIGSLAFHTQEGQERILSNENDSRASSACFGEEFLINHGVDKGKDVKNPFRNPKQTQKNQGMASSVIQSGYSADNSGTLRLKNRKHCHFIYIFALIKATNASRISANNSKNGYALHANN